MNLSLDVDVCLLLLCPAVAVCPSASPTIKTSVIFRMLDKGCVCVCGGGGDYLSIQ